MRVSRIAGRSGESYISPRVQRESIERWASYKSLEIDAWHVDEDWSGGTHRRPGLESAVGRCLSGDSDGIVSANIDRFSRTTELGLRDLRRLEEVGARLAFVAEDIDTATVYGRMIYTIMLAVAEAYLANIKASWRVAKERAVARGAYVSRTPWGYSRNEDGTLSPHPERSPIVLEAFRMAAGSSIQDSMRYLRRVAPERDWTTTKVRRLLSQRSYLGETHNGDCMKKGTHDPIVSRSIWEAAQSTPSSRKPRDSYPLSGLPRCGACGAPMTGSRGGRGQRTYRCAGAQNAVRRTCGAGPIITAEILEGFLRDALRGSLSGLRATVSDPEVDQLAPLERALLDAEVELDAFASDLTMRRALGDRYHVHLQRRVDDVETARDAYREKARESQGSVSLSFEDMEEDPQLFPVLLRSVFAEIVVSPGRGDVADRVRFVPVDPHGSARVADAKST